MLADGFPPPRQAVFFEEVWQKHAADRKDVGVVVTRLVCVVVETDGAVNDGGMEGVGVDV